MFVNARGVFKSLGIQDEKHKVGCGYLDIHHNLPDFVVIKNVMYIAIQTIRIEWLVKYIITFK